MSCDVKHVHLFLCHKFGGTPWFGCDVRISHSPQRGMGLGFWWHGLLFFAGLFVVALSSPKWQVFQALRMLFLHYLLYLHAQHTRGSCRTKLIIRLLQVTFFSSLGLQS